MKASNCKTAKHVNRSWRLGENESQCAGMKEPDTVTSARRSVEKSDSFNLKIRTLLELHSRSRERVFLIICWKLCCQTWSLHKLQLETTWLYSCCWHVALSSDVTLTLLNIRGRVSCSEQLPKRSMQDKLPVDTTDVLISFDNSNVLVSSSVWTFGLFGAYWVLLALLLSSF